jgi:hypothetical protein
MKRGGDAADDDLVRTSVSQDRVTAASVTIVPQDSVYIALNISER